MMSRRVAGYLLIAGSLMGGCGDSVKPLADSSAKPSASSSARPALTGIDTSALTPRERRELDSQLDELKAPCPGMDLSLTQCISEKRDCKQCMLGANFLVREVRSGKPKAERAAAFKDRFDPSLVKKVEVGDAPTMGPASAVVTIIEWADFECPGCLAMYPIFDRMVERFPGQVRFAYKFFPLSIHQNGEVAARAGIAADKQGKFWEMHHRLFENQEHNDRRSIERIAKSLGLEMAKFKSDMTDADTTARVERDKAEANGLGLNGTPFVFINGREVKPEQMASFEDDLEAWVKAEIELAGQVPNSPSEKWKKMGGGAIPGGGSSAQPAVAPSASVAPPTGSVAPSTSATSSPASSAAKDQKK